MKRSARRTAESGPPEGNHHGTGGGMVTPVSSGTAAAADVPGAAAEAIEDGEAAVAARTPSEYTREPINKPSTLVGVPSPEALASAPRCTRATRLAAGAVAEEPKIALTAAVLLERRNKMFVAGTPEPTASGMAVATALTNEDVQLASVVVAGWKQDDITALSRSFGNFDRVVALGWLLGDLLDLPWLERKQAHSFGLAAGKKAGKVEEEIKAMKKRASSRASKLKQGDLEARHALEAAAAAEQAALLQKDAELTLPEAPRTATLSTKRKRAASPEPEQPEPEAAEPTLPELVSDRDAKRAELRAAHAAAGAASARADEAHDAWEQRRSSRDQLDEQLNAEQDAAARPRLQRRLETEQELVKAASTAADDASETWSQRNLVHEKAWKAFVLAEQEVLEAQAFYWHGEGLEARRSSQEWQKAAEERQEEAEDWQEKAEAAAAEIKDLRLEKQMLERALLRNDRCFDDGIDAPFAYVDSGEVHYWICEDFSWADFRSRVRERAKVARLQRATAREQARASRERERQHKLVQQGFLSQEQVDEWRREDALEDAMDDEAEAA